MPAIYSWDSPRKSSEVLETISTLTEPSFKERLKQKNPYSFRYKRLSETEVTFLFSPAFTRYRSDMPPNVKGSVQDAAEGCHITAQKEEDLFAYISKVVSFVAIFILGFYFLFLTETSTWFFVIFAIVFLFMAIFMLFPFLSQYKRAHNIENIEEIAEILENINKAAGAEFQKTEM